MNRALLPVIGLGRSTVKAISEVGYIAALFAEALYWTVLGGRHGQQVSPALIAKEMVATGVSALPIALALSATVGLMLAMQLIATLREFGAQSQAVLATSIAVCREFGPLIVGIVVAGRTASALAARLGSMTVSQEVDALQVLGVEPVRQLVAPALIALLLVMPCLTLLADAAAILAAGLLIAPALDVGLTGYINQVFASLEPFDVTQGLIKSVVFGALIGLIGCAVGLNVKGGAEGVGLATTRAVVLAISSIVVADMAFTFYLTR